MRLAITAGNSPLARSVCAVLPAEVQIRLIDTQFTAPPQAELLSGDLRDPEFADQAVAGADVVLHLEPIMRSGDDVVDLDRATRGTYQLYTTAAAAGVRRLLLGSTLALFDRLPPGTLVDERWRPRPTTAATDLCAWLSEICVRELARDLALPTLCLRFGRIVDDTAAAAYPNDARRLHIADAADAVRRALAYNEPGWSILHIAAGPYAQPPLGAARADLGFEPRHIFQHSPFADSPQIHWRDALLAPPAASRLIRRVVIFGAGGPLASSVTKELAHDYLLRLTDIEPLAAIAARGQPQLPGAPLPDPPGPPHEIALVDVTDPDAVLAACADADAIINCSVIRRDPVEAFRVNALGAYNILRAAVAHGITRVVHTGPYQVAEVGATGYMWDYDVPDEAPPRPGCNHQWQLYLHSKWLGQEICRVFAETHGLSIPALLFVQFVNPEYPERPHLAPFAVSWRDAARAVRAALETTTLPSPYEVFHVSADLPHGVFRFDKIRRVLGWEAQDTLDGFWRAPADM